MTVPFHRPIRANKRGNVALVIVIMSVAMTLILLGSLQTVMITHTLGEAWESRRSRETVANSLSMICKETVLSRFGLGGNNDTTPLATQLANRTAGVWSGGAVTVTDNTDYSTTIFQTFRGVPQWPNDTPGVVSDLDFSLPGGRSLGRNFQALLAAGPVVDLGTMVFNFRAVQASFPDDAADYRVNARLFGVPITNFSFIPYGMPTESTGIVGSAPAGPPFAWTRDLDAVLVHAMRSGDSGSYLDMYGSLPANTVAGDLPSYYRDLVSLGWDAFTYIRGGTYLNTLRLRAMGANTFYSFAAPSTLPSGLAGVLTVPSTGQVSVNLSSLASQNLIVIEDDVGGRRINLSGATGTVSSTPVLVLIRNTSATQSVIHLATHINRPVFLLAQNASIQGASNPTSLNGYVMCFPNTSITTDLTITGGFFYPQNSNLASRVVGLSPNSTLEASMAAIAPRILLVSTRAFP